MDPYADPRIITAMLFFDNGLVSDRNPEIFFSTRRIQILTGGIH